MKKEGRARTEGTSSSIGSRCSAQSTYDKKEEDQATLHRKIHCSYKIEQVAEVFSTMEGPKEQMLRSMKFDGLIKLPRIESNAFKCVNRQLGFWLLMHLNGDKGVLDLGDKGTIPLTGEDVALILGISCVGEELVISDQQKLEQTKGVIKRILMLDDEDILDLDTVRRVLDRDLIEMCGKSERDAFMVASAIYATSYFLAPKGRPPRINTDILEALLEPANICNVNWSSYVLKTLVACSNKVKNDVKANTKTVTLEGCLLVLQIAYLDNLDFGSYSTSHFLTPRVAYFTKEIMDRLTNMDKASFTFDQEYKFGQTEVRHPSETMYSRGKRYRRLKASMRGAGNITVLIEYINECNEEHKRRVRNQHKAFAEEQLKGIDEFNDHINSVLRTWAGEEAANMASDFIGTDAKGTAMGAARSQKVETTMTMSVPEGGVEDKNSDQRIVLYSAPKNETAGQRSDAIKDKRLLLANADALLATNKQGRTKHVAYRRRIDKKKRRLEDNGSGGEEHQMQ